MPLEAGIRRGNLVKEARKARNSKRKPSHTICRMQPVTVYSVSVDAWHDSRVAFDDGRTGTFDRTVRNTYAERLSHHLANIFIFSLEWMEMSDIASSLSGVLLSLSLVGWG